MLNFEKWKDVILAYGSGLEKAAKIGQVYVPGLPILPIGTERYSISGGGSQTVQIVKGDNIELVDREGLQPGEITFFDSNGISRASYLGVESDGSANGLQVILQSKEASAKRAMLF